MGKVILVGAGPGDAGLITVRGLEEIKECDVLIYDRLAAEELLGQVRQDCVLVYVGKKPGAHSMKQDEINRILVDYGRTHEKVVRLKGGDSFVFGRGGEEIGALAQAGIPYEVIPGITSCVAVPESAGIPVTHRGVAQSFHVITGHTKDGKNTLTEDYDTLARLNGTLVFLMGLSNLCEITERLLRCGKAADTPAAVIENGTTPRERIVRGTLSDIAARAGEAGLTSPVVIVIGATAALHFCMEEGAECGGIKRQYGMVGTARTMQAFGRLMAEQKKSVIPLMEMQICGTERAAELDREILHIAEYAWVLFTSKQAVETFFEAYHRMGMDIRRLFTLRFGVIGRGTSDALAAHGIRADFMPTQADAESFARQFAAQYARGKQEALSGDEPARILIPRAKQGSRIFSDILAAAGFAVCEICVYDVVGRESVLFSVEAPMQDFVFFSASGVRAFFAECRRRAVLPTEGSTFFCLGHLTWQAVLQEIAEQRQERYRIITAEEQSIDGLVKKICATAGIGNR